MSTDEAVQGEEMQQQPEAQQEQAAKVESTPSVIGKAFKAGSAMSGASVVLLFTLDLTKNNIVARFPGIKALNAVESEDGSTYNLYNPFKGLSKADKEKGGKFKGLFRQQFNKVLEFAAEIENSNIVMVGSQQNVQNALSSIANDLLKAIAGTLPFNSDAVLAQIVVDENGTTEDLTFNDLIKMESWVNSNGILGRADGEVSVFSNIVINFIVNAPALHESKDLAKSVLQAFNSLSNMATKAESEVTLLGAVRVDGETLMDVGMFEAVGTLIENEFDIYTRRNLESNTSNSDFTWSPTTKKDIGTKLLNDDTDLLLFNVLGSEDEGDDAAAE